MRFGLFFFKYCYSFLLRSVNKIVITDYKNVFTIKVSNEMKLLVIFRSM